MKKFIIRFALFISPLIAGWIALLNVDVPKEFAYDYMGDECEGQGRWLYSRFYLQDQPADIVFIGASRTMRAVDDSLLQHYFDSTGTHVNIINAGFCRFGRDLFTLIAEDALASQGHVRTLVFEVNEYEGSGNHPVYWSLASTSDLVYPESFVNQSYFSNIWSGSLLRIDYLSSTCFDPKESSAPSGKYFGCLHTDVVADDEDMNRAYAHCHDGSQCQPANAMENLRMIYNKAWISRLASSAQAQNTSLVFLYLPQYGCTTCPPREAEFYRQFGNVLIPPSSILDNRKNWSDHDHFNNRGSREMAKWLFSVLNEGQ